MKIRLWPRLGLVLVAALGLATLVTCEGTVIITLTNTVHGTVVDARIDPDSGSPQIGSVLVVLKNASGTQVDTDTTASDGTFTFFTIDPGSYTISASRSGYAFIDKPVVVAGNDITIEAGNVMGFSSGANEISLIAVWSSSFTDVDAHLTIPVDDAWNFTPVFTNPYMAVGDTTPGDTLTGFFADNTSFREDIRFNNPTSTATVDAFRQTGLDTTTPAVRLDVDILGGSGPETISILEMPIPVNSPLFNTTGNPATNGLPSNATYDYSFVGVAQYYVHAFESTTLSTEGAAGGAQVEVYVVQGSVIKGRFVLPDYITIDKASVVRINMFVLDGATTITPYYQFVPDVRIADYSGIRGLTSGPIVLAGTPRQK